MSVNNQSTQGESSCERQARSTIDLAEREVVEAIQNTRRRYALYYLHKRDGAVDVSEVVDQVALWEHYPATDQVPTDKRRSVYSSLHQTHLPYLEAHGLVEWKREINRVECRLDDAMWDLLLANDPRTSIRWYRVFPLAGALGILVIGLAWAGVGPLAGVSAITIGLLVSVAYATLGALYWYDVYRWRRRMEGMPPDFIVSFDSSIHSRQSTGEDETDDDR